MNEAKEKTVTTSPLRAIRLNCIKCCFGRAYAVKLCTVEDCPLYPFRFGVNPFKKGAEYEEHKRNR